MSSEKRILQCGPYSYSPDDSLGHGSFAEVFRGRSKDGIEVAIKRIPKSKLGRANHRRLLETEISILQTLRHPNIVQLLDNQDSSDFIFLIMEYCNGGDLNSYISQHAPMSESDIAIFLRQLVEALNYLSLKSILHRDLKPQNILLHSTGPGLPTIKIADFGFARELFQEDLAATFCGSPLYMAPEVLEGEAYNAMADLWSVGTIVYQCLTGIAPFRAPNIKALKDLIHAGNGPLIPETASPAMADLLTGLLRVDPHARMSLAKLSAHPFLAGPSSRRSSIGSRPGTASKRPEGGAAEGLEIMSVSKDVDDRSYVLVDKGFVDINTLADSLERRIRVSPSQALTGRSPTDLITMLERVIKPATVVISLANERFLSYQDNPLAASTYSPMSRLQARGEALLLYGKALTLLRSGLSTLRPLIGRGVQLTPALYNAVQTLRSRFNESTNKIESIRADFTPAGMRTVFASAEQLLYNHALTLAREAARSEVRGNFDNSEVLYDRALTLLEAVLSDAQEQESIDIQKLLLSLRDRLVVVKQKHHEQEQQRVARSATLASTPEDSAMEGGFGQQLVPVERSPVPQIVATEGFQDLNDAGFAFGTTPRMNVRISHPSSANLAIDSPPPRVYSEPILITGNVRPVERLRTLNTIMQSSSPPSVVSPRQSPGSSGSPSSRPLRPAALRGGGGAAFNSVPQRFCGTCGAPRSMSLEHRETSPTY